MELAATHVDPVYRISLAVVAFAAAFSSNKIRKKKAFNPMLGETFELVTDNLKYLCEKIAHIPDGISCECLDGKSYRHYRYNKP